AVTLVFTDIEGSTSLLRRLHDAYAAMLAEHHAILDRCFGAEGGTRLSTEGDGGFFVFAETEAAVRAAVAAQEALASHPWPNGERVRVRMGIHTGEAARTKQGGYIGLAVHLAARITALGHGGQILISEAARRLVADGVNGTFADLGVHALADFPEPVRLFQVGSADERFDPLKGRAERGLPATIGRLFGREDEITELLDLVGSHRLVTVLGPGGTGKTRLAIETGRQLRSRGIPVHFVDLTGVSAPDLMPAHVAASLEMGQDPQISPVRQIAATLGRSGALLVLDNCEHLMPAANSFVVDLLEADADASILATSRVPLSIPGERLFDLDPLAVGSDPSSPALALFLDRAADLAPDFEVDEAGMVHVRDVVARLDGLPLAIELAASMVRFLPIEELADVLTERLDLLEGGPARPDRHRSLAAALRWSVDSLEAGAREAFECLGVMTGPFTLDDVAAVVGTTTSDALAIATQLSGNSLLTRSRVQGRTVFRMLETMRWFALESLEADGSHAEVRDRHMEHFRSLAVDARAAVRGPSAADLLARLWPRRPNVLTALDHAIQSGRHEAAVQIVEGLVDAWAIRSAGREARVATTKVLEAVAGGDPNLELRAVFARLEVWQAQGVGIAPERALAEKAFELASRSDDPSAQIRARIWMIGAGVLPWEDHDALLDQLEAVGAPRAVGYGTEALGWMLWWLDRQGESMALFRRLLDRATGEGDMVGVLDAIAGMTATARGAEEIAAVSKLVDEIAQLVDRIGCTWWEGFQLQWRAHHSRELGYLDESAEWLDRAYRVALDRGTINQIAFIT
ncbi:MAG TPA: adenylate/guanylate cyclase domain-containing protein, partial [Acidimicrobiia bacterium]|nr:adenylate/guanylate cyclase domain-containing protein [Acidimicrobiia bacterium]